MTDHNEIGREDQSEVLDGDRPTATMPAWQPDVALCAALNAAGDAIAIKDADLRFRFVNEALCRAVGRPADAILGKTDRDLFPDDVAILAALDDRTVLRTRRSVKREYLLPTVDGLLWVGVRKDPVIVDERPVGVITVARDISHSIETERRLRTSTDLLDRFFSQGVFAVAYLDRTLTILRVNEAFAHIGDGHAADFVGRAYETAFPHSDMVPLFRRVLNTGAPITETARPNQPTGRRQCGATYWDVSVQPVRDTAGVLDGLILTVGDVTDRVRREDDLRRSRELYKGLFDGSTAIMFLVDPDDGRFLEANAAAAAFYGHSRATLQQMHIHDLNTRPVARIREDVQQARRRDRNVFQVQHQLASGEIRDVEIHATPLDLDGRTVLFSIVHDITDRARAEAALRASEREKALILGSVTDLVVFFTSPDLRIHWCNRASAEALGSDTQSLIGTHCYQHWADRDSPCPGCPVQRCFETGAPTEAEQETPDGRVWSIHAYPAFDEQGALSGVVEVGRDITEPRASQAALARSLANLHAFFDSSRDFLTVRDEDGCIVAVNRTVETRLGWPAQDLVGRSVTLLHPEEVPVDATAHAGAPMTADPNESNALPLLTREGHRIPVETTVVRGTWDGRPVLFGTSRDISELALSRQMFETTFRDNATLMLITEPDTGKVVDANRAFLKTLGLTEAEVIGRTTVDLGLIQDAESREALIKVMLKGDTGVPPEVSLTARDGRTVVGQVSGRLIASGRQRYLLSMVTDITRQRALMNDLQHKATHDSLTGVYNRQETDRVLDLEIRRADRMGTPLSLILADLDHFKAVNDRLGHLAGDRVLCEVVGRLSHRIRETDMLARWGGEEFLILLPGTDARGASQLAETLRRAVADAAFREAGVITLSQGVAAYRTGETVSDWIARADAALYAAKAAGRNRVCGD